MGTRGPDKVMFAADYPLLEVEKCAGDLAKLNLATPVLEATRRATPSAYSKPADAVTGRPPLAT
jgi:hypothetical protein